MGDDTKRLGFRYRWIYPLICMIVRHDPYQGGSMEYSRDWTHCRRCLDTVPWRPVRRIPH